MCWYKEFDLILFDFDGLLVNTEELHYLAYKQMCADRGVDLQWSFNRYCKAAHYSATAVREQLAEEYPELFKQEPKWSVLYEEKRKNITRLIVEGAFQLMPGVAELLTALAQTSIKRCVVTHSPSDIVNAIRHKHALLNTIPYWITREDYNEPKPNSECYQKAIATYAKPGDNIVGFEDTPRGIKALLGTSALPVLICEPTHPGVEEMKRHKNVLYFPSFEAIPKNDLQGQSGVKPVIVT